MKSSIYYGKFKIEFRDVRRFKQLYLTMSKSQYGSRYDWRWGSKKRRCQKQNITRCRHHHRRDNIIEGLTSFNSRIYDYCDMSCLLCTLDTFTQRIYKLQAFIRYCYAFTPFRSRENRGWYPFSRLVFETFHFHLFHNYLYGRRKINLGVSSFTKLCAVMTYAEMETRKVGLIGNQENSWFTVTGQNCVGNGLMEPTQSLTLNLFMARTNVFLPSFLLLHWNWLRLHL